MNRVFCFSIPALVAGLSCPASATIATTNYVEVVPIDNTAVLSGYSTYDLMMTTPESDWTTAGILLELTSGTIYQAPMGSDLPVPTAMYEFLPELEFDTCVGVPGSYIAGGVGDIDRRMEGAVVSTPTTLAVSFYNFDKTDIGTFSIGRVTLTNDAVGSWSLIANTGDNQRVDLVGTIDHGQIFIDPAASLAAAEAAYYSSDEYLRTLPRPTFERDNSTFVSLLKPLGPLPDQADESTAPEPGTLALLGLGGLALLRR